VLAPNAGLRAVIVPGPAHKPGEHSKEHAHAAERMGWARLLRRVFELNLEHCPQCGGNLRIIAAIGAPAVIVRILTHLVRACESAAALTGATCARALRSECVKISLDGSTRRPTNSRERGAFTKTPRDSPFPGPVIQLRVKNKVV
jgi:hypothetical protein